VDEIVGLAPSGSLGSGYNVESFNRALDANPDFIGQDAGSTDMGPTHLGDGVLFFPESSYRHDLSLMLNAAREREIPLLVGSCITAGTRGQLGQAVAMVKDLAREAGHSFKMAVIDAELDKDYLKKRLADGAFQSLGPEGELTPADIDRSSHIVAQMGVEPFIRALEANKLISDPYFFPLYEMAAEFDMPICLHSGNASFDVVEIFREEPGFNKFKACGIGCFHQLLWNHIPRQFPEVRWGFVELSAQWIPYALNDISLRMERRGEELSEDVLGDNNMFVACQVTDDLDYILAAVGDDNIVVGTDYGHNDTSTEIEALRRLRSDGKISAKAADKILDANAKRLYALN